MYVYVAFSKIIFEDSKCFSSMVGISTNSNFSTYYYVVVHNKLNALQPRYDCLLELAINGAQICNIATVLLSKLTLNFCQMDYMKYVTIVVVFVNLPLPFPGWYQ